MLEGSLFMTVRDKAHRFVKPARSFVLAHHGQLNHFHAPARMIENGRDKYFPKPGFSRSASNIHRPKQSLMRVLRTFLRGKSGYSHKPPVKESAKNIRAANGRLEPRQRLRVFFLERAAESLGIFLESFQPYLPVEGRVSRLQATDLRAANIGHDCTSLGLV
jgi:hypothetical protein